MLYYIWDKKTDQIKTANFVEWNSFLEDNKAILVAEDTFDEYLVSTFFTGVHGFDEGKPLLFQTMTFSFSDGLYTEQYPSSELARLGHQKALDWVKAQKK